MNKNIKLLSLFSGIGAFEKALHNIGVNYELINYCEIDKFASKSYSLIHNVDESKNLIDVTKIDTSKLPHDIDWLHMAFHVRIFQTQVSKEVSSIVKVKSQEVAYSLKR